MAKNDKGGKKDDVGAFPKIGAVSRIETFTVKKGKKKIQLGSIKISGGQAETLLSLADSGEDIRVSFETIQGKLPGTQ